MAIVLLLLASCASIEGGHRPAEADWLVSVQSTHTADDEDGTYVGVDVLFTDPEGLPLPCGSGDLALVVEVSSAGDAGPWTPLPSSSITRVCSEEPTGRVGLVIDNSGSESGYLEDLRVGAGSMVDGVIAAGGKASLVRVSTNSGVVVPMTADAGALHGGLDALAVNEGWTSLFDGVRQGNETLATDAAATSSVGEFCTSARRLGLVVFTDGQENNSADEQDYDHALYPGDGIATTAEDLYDLQSGGASTPIYTIGLGDNVDDETLAALAAETGGRYRKVESPDELPAAWGLVSDYFTANEQVCGRLEEPVCGQVWVRVNYTWTDGTSTVEGSVIEQTSVDCPTEPAGRTAVMLLTLSNPGISASLGAQLAAQSVDWASPAESPEVLVVLDENHHDENAGDADVIAGMLEGAGYSVTRLDELDGGITSADLAAYDVVWYSNPGYPMDDPGSMQALAAFSEAGGGLVLQGDDMAWSWGGGFSMSPLTHLDFVDNGTAFCGHATDNNGGESYRVTFGSGAHPLLGDLQGQSFLYGDDIDTTVAEGDAEVLATATLDGSTDCGTVPVIVALQP